MGDKIHIIGGGTFSYVRNHLALSAPAFGSTARNLYRQIYRAMEVEYFVSTPTVAGEDVVERHTAGQEYADVRVHLHLTKMADHTSNLVTNDDVAGLLAKLTADPETRVIILPAALCDYDGDIVIPMGEAVKMLEADEPPVQSGSHAPRLKTVDGKQMMALTPAAKLIGDIRKTRKDIFVVGFKTTTNAASDDQYKIALSMLKANSLNLVLANDTVTRNNMIVAPEETRYHETTNREEVVTGLVKIVLARSQNTFTRSTVVPGELVDFNSDPKVPANLREVVNYCLSQGAYKPFRGSTAGHFAVRLDEGRCLTSRRKTNYNKPGGLDLVEVEYDGLDKVIAKGAKPSVGGQSQRIVFTEHPDLDCIVHAHVPLRMDHRDPIAVAPQWQNECGSHQCGQNTSRHLTVYRKTDLRAVMLEEHGPNIVFSRTTPAAEVIDFIEANFDLSAKTGGWVS